MILRKKKYGYLDMFMMSFIVSPFFTLFAVFMSLIDALLPALRIFAIAYFINAAIAAYNQEIPLSVAYIAALLLLTLRLYPMLANVFLGFLNIKREIYFRNKLSPLIVEYVAKLQYRYMESQKSKDIIKRVFEDDFPAKIWQLFQQILGVVNLVVYVGGIVVILMMQMWWFGLTLLISTIPLLYIANIAGKKSYEADRDMTSIDRQANYLSEVMRKREAAEERTMFGYTKELNKIYGTKFEYSLKYRMHVAIKNYMKQSLGGIIPVCYAIITILVLIPSVSSGLIGLGMFIGLVGAVFGLSDQLWAVNNMTASLVRNHKYLEDLTTVMTFETVDGAVSAPEFGLSFNTIVFNNVKFFYPTDENVQHPKIVLDGVSFTINKDRRYAFVGENGAGKTTIIKLLTGLYDNYEGEILIDNRELRSLPHEQIKGLFSVVFQDFARYYMPLIDNIILSDPNNPNVKEKAEEAVVLFELSQTLEKLKYGINTPLGKIYENGEDVSSGEWQRIALARSFLNPAPLKILDEPTASLDPIGESIVYNNFNKITKNNTTILISHRLGSTKLADTIFVLKKGKIVEHGNHSELMALNGEYASMYNIQAEWYKNEFVGEVKNDV